MGKREGSWGEMPALGMIELRRPAARFAAKGRWDFSGDDTPWRSVSAWIALDKGEPFEKVQAFMREATSAFERDFKGLIQSASSGFGPMGEGSEHEALANTYSWSLLPRSLPGSHAESAREEFAAAEERDWQAAVGRFHAWALKNFGDRVALTDGRDESRFARTQEMLAKVAALREKAALALESPKPAKRGVGSL